MPDAFEEQLATRLRTLASTVGDDLIPPPDLELLVTRRRRRARSARRWSGLAAVAAVVVVLGAVAAVHDTTVHGSIHVESPSTPPTTPDAPVRDSLQPGTVMLSARGHYVISLDSNGRTNATMVAVRVGEISYARATDDHRKLWYLSKDGKQACGDVVRADIDEGHSSTIVAHAVAFDISPDGTKLALYGSGDLAHGQCAPVTATSPGRVVVEDLTSGVGSSVAVGAVTAMRWSADGSYLVYVGCSAAGCRGIDVLDVAPGPGGALVAESPTVGISPPWSTRAATLAFGRDGLYSLSTTLTTGGGSGAGRSRTQIDRFDPREKLKASTMLFDGGARWSLSQVVPTDRGVYVVAAPVVAGPKVARLGPTGLYRLAGRNLVFVRSLAAPGALDAGCGVFGRLSRPPGPRRAGPIRATARACPLRSGRRRQRR